MESRFSWRSEVDQGATFDSLELVKKRNPIRERDLQPWKSPSEPEYHELLEANRHELKKEKWDQFHVNAEKFGYSRAPINEAIYTTPLDRTSDFYKSRSEEAVRISNEIQAASCKDRSSDDEKKECASINLRTSRSPGAYVPPFMRKKMMESCLDEKYLNGCNETEKNISEALLAKEKPQGKVDGHKNDNMPFSQQEECQEGFNSVVSHDKHTHEEAECANKCLHQTKIEKTEGKPNELAKPEIKMNINAPEFHPKGYFSMTRGTSHPYYYYSSPEFNVTNGLYYPFYYSQHPPLYSLNFQKQNYPPDRFSSHSKDPSRFIANKACKKEDDVNIKKKTPL